MELKFIKIRISFTAFSRKQNIYTGRLLIYTNNKQMYIRTFALSSFWGEKLLLMQIKCWASLPSSSLLEYRIVSYKIRKVIYALLLHKITYSNSHDPSLMEATVKVKSCICQNAILLFCRVLAIVTTSASVDSWNFQSHILKTDAYTTFRGTELVSFLQSRF
jgi:hypothetical protein